MPTNIRHKEKRNERTSAELGEKLRLSMIKALASKKQELFLSFWKVKLRTEFAKIIDSI